MSDEFKILMILVCTFCFSIIMGMVGVVIKLVDPQYVEGLISGGLITLITMLFKDILNKNGGQNATNLNSNVPVVSTSNIQSTDTTTK